MEQGSAGQEAAQWRIVLAFAALYIIWGSTYLAIKVAIETIPPFLMAMTRFLIAGIILYAFSRLRGIERPSVNDWKHSFIVGGLLVAGGNGLVSFAELWIESNMAALLIAGNPLFMTLFAWWGKVQQRPSLKAFLSLGIGFLGVGFLVGFRDASDSSGSLLGSALVILAIISWSVGSVYSKRNPVKLDAWLQSGMQMICGGLVCLLAGSLAGEFSMVDVSAISLRSWISFLYLIFFGSLAGFTSYVYLLRHRSPSAVSSHAYVNPVVAVLLGWLILGETLTLGGMIGSGLVLIAVFELLRQK